ncbi:MAG: patatin [Xanthomonadales bacterium]|nr:patatin-like phospholipase family protein [Gammaproteobacteria bacterium]MBT8050863.1 patatin-like phospholipase family protein [Gammaproteobacteria bacterium]MBT8055895.1 patatin-like phospholipase family protein [Gammaproteobacteria bacterium]NNJ78191.1 patatin [Xanthomonadales bacterium]NNL04312.1 patatin [Xanthomonadales bacterium]
MTEVARKTSRAKPVPKIALVLGSGAARGWAHIGVIRELEELGIKPDLVVGSSVGAVVGGAYASDNLDRFETWIQGLRRVDIIRLLDLKMSGGGFLQGKSLMGAIEQQIGDPAIEDLDIPYACVATELGSGREVWLREGSLLEACRASIALPGMFAPTRADDGQLLVDGGLVNPVPVSLARALGGDIVIAVNLNGDIIGRHFFLHDEDHNEDDGDVQDSERRHAEEDDSDEVLGSWSSRLKTGIGVSLDSYISSLRKKESPDPGLFDVMAGSIDIMQDRITRSRMAGEPPDIHITPKLSHIGLMDFDRGEESVAEGREATRRRIEELAALPGVAMKK